MLRTVAGCIRGLALDLAVEKTQVVVFISRRKVDVPTIVLEGKSNPLVLKISRHTSGKQGDNVYSPLACDGG